MHAIVVREFGGPEVLRLEELLDRRPGPADVLVRVRAAGVNPVDTYIRAGAYATKPPLPFTPGTDAAGVVEAVGADVRGFAAGDRVYLFGTTAGRTVGAYASMAVCDPSRVFRLPDGLSFAEGAAIGIPYSTAWRALFERGRARAGETVLVHGASGGVGIAAVQLARRHGLTVVGTAGTDEGLGVVRAQGAHHAVSHRERDYHKAILELTGGRGVDLILEMLASANLDRDLTLLAPGGRAVVIGSRGRIEIDPRQMMGKETAILGLMLWNAAPEAFTAMQEALARAMEEGGLRPVVSRELPLAEARKAHELVMTPGARGKIVLVP